MLTEMSRKEMIGRLEDGEDPLEVSIMKWQRMWMLMKCYPNTYVPERYGSRTCALCSKYLHHICMGCPLEDAGYGCDSLDGDSPWQLFTFTLDIVECGLMLDALKECRLLKKR